MTKPANPRKTDVKLNLRVQNTFTLDDGNKVTCMNVVAIAMNLCLFQVVSFIALMKTKWVDERLSIMNKTNCWKNISEIATVCGDPRPPGIHTVQDKTTKVPLSIFCCFMGHKS